MEKTISPKIVCAIKKRYITKTDIPKKANALRKYVTDLLQESVTTFRSINTIEKQIIKASKPNRCSRYSGNIITTLSIIYIIVL
ncbi:MAG: hypothetical protein ACMXYE_05050 [Candidatus Woesearchaeota archaeon]